MAIKYVPPGLSETAFNCPHCGALAKQFWHSVHTRELDDDKVPRRISARQESEIDYELVEEENRDDVKQWARRMASDRPFIEPVRSEYHSGDLWNVSMSRCFNCDQLALWIADRMIWPSRGEAPPPNSDMPADILVDYEEAGTILDLSPRGSAALLRLCIQKLCKELGEKGKNIDEDIAALVKKGLDVRVQQALDIVRVIGNNAVHPGRIDLRDDRATAEKLFGLVNLIVEIMVSQPLHVAEMFSGLPAANLRAIEDRDKE